VTRLTSPPIVTLADVRRGWLPEGRRRAPACAESAVLWVVSAQDSGLADDTPLEALLAWWTPKRAIELARADGARDRLGAVAWLCRALGDVLIGADLRGADLRGVDLRGVDLRGVVMIGAVMIGADLTDADLSDAVMIDVDMTGADLTDADLFHADMTGADLTDAILTRAILDDDAADVEVAS